MDNIVSDHFTLTALISLIFGYVLGSIPFGLVITKLAGLGDIRDIGSGNIGATNVLRTGRKDLAVLTLILDSGKGAAAVLIAAQIWGLQGAMGAALGSVLGHLFPVWLHFKGGKGVATTLGVLLAFAPLAGVAACLTWLVTAVIFRISSLAALTAMALAPVWTAILYTPKWSYLVATLGILVWIKHSENIKRLVAGTEPKIGKKKKGDSDVAA
ncbi:MAG TPA: glycerol-3-phosphate 1-O-acyltransferase PlsY [Alphaproteobacteria bacterium]